MKNYESLVDAMDDLRKRGYEADFEPQSDCLYCSNLDLRLNEEEFNVDEVYRFASAWIKCFQEPSYLFKNSGIIFGL